MLRIKEKRIDFVVEGDSVDVTDIINSYRNASCHFGSKSRQMNCYARVSFLCILGKSVGISTPLGSLENPFSNDVAYFYGNIRIFHKRHLIRAAGEAKEKLLEAARFIGFDGPLAVNSYEVLI